MRSRGTSASSIKTETPPRVPVPPPSALETSFEADSLSSLDENSRDKILAELSREEAAALARDWRFWGRPTQIPPAGDWRVWVLLAGRGFGKTRTGAEWVRMQVEEKRAKRVVVETAVPGPQSG